MDELGVFSVKKFQPIPFKKSLEVFSTLSENFSNQKCESLSRIFNFAASGCKNTVGSQYGPHQQAS
jgi:hypothetical protein